jgi:DNA-binding NarL/FixJ family response regulator
MRADMAVVAQTGRRGGCDAFQHKPDVTLMDLRPKMMVLIDTRNRGRWPSARFVVLTTYEGDEDIHRALEMARKVT